MKDADNWREQCIALARTIRAHCLRMTHSGKGGHVGSMLSIAEVLAVLYGRVLRVDPARPDWPERDRFVLSKGHAGAAVYAALAERGFFPMEWLDTYYQDGGKLMGHICHKVPGVEFSTGSLGHGLPVACGMAVAAKRRGEPQRVFCLMSDGDVDAGSTNEAILFAAQQKLDNLVAILDYNKIQALGATRDVLDLEPLTDRLQACRWAVREVDGHDIDELETTLQHIPLEAGKPSWVTAHTIKGKGISWMENTVSCHFGYVNAEELEKALEEIGA